MPAELRTRPGGTLGVLDPRTLSSRDGVTALRVELATPGTSPVDAALHILAAELNAMKMSLSSVEEPATAIAAHRRFGDLIRATPVPARIETT
ncbi:hypothetical protein [Micromonospora sp. NBC_01412]|uniref:hypothetical protein n=1 Tax=Micromonospora sp. NBC_01412 TaxID=2903590 RepID=UPI0032558AB0